MNTSRGTGVKYVIIAEPIFVKGGGVLTLTYAETLPVCREYFEWYVYAIKKNLVKY
jgi:hypothetical protein